MIEPWNCIGADKYKEGEVEGLAEGKAEGRADGILTMVRNLIKAGVSDNVANLNNYLLWGGYYEFLRFTR